MKRNLALLCAAKNLLTIFLLFQLDQANNNVFSSDMFISNDYSELLSPTDNLIEKGTYSLDNSKEKAYSSNSYSLPKSEFYSDNSILLPIYMPMDDEDNSYVIDSVKKFI